MWQFVTVTCDVMLNPNPKFQNRKSIKNNNNNKKSEIK